MKNAGGDAAGCSRLQRRAIILERKQELYAAGDDESARQRAERPVNVESNGHAESEEAHQAGHESVVGHGAGDGREDGYNDFGILVVLVGVQIAVDPYAVADHPDQLEEVMGSVDDAAGNLPGHCRGVACYECGQRCSRPPKTRVH